MRLHERERAVDDARLELMEAVLAWRRAHPDLTFGEMFSIIGDVVGDQDEPGGVE